jgi:hypothetical protein
LPITSVLPSSAIVEVATAFKSQHLFILAYGPKYVLKCQSHFSSASLSSLNKTIVREYEMMTKIISNSLSDNCVSASDKRAKEFFASLKDLLTQLYRAKLPDQQFRRARQEYDLTQQIRNQLCSKNNQIVLRRTDKSKVFHLGSMEDYRQKAIAYMNKTCAYEHVKDNKSPLAYNLLLVITLLDRFLKRKSITQKQYVAMKPNQNKAELGHLYFLPKPHKVRSMIVAI